MNIPKIEVPPPMPEVPEEKEVVTKAEKEASEIRLAAMDARFKLMQKLEMTA